MNKNLQPTTALVRNLPKSFAQCLKKNEPVTPIDLQKAEQQHHDYVQALKKAGLKITEIPADEKHPDCCFIEDTAVVIGQRAAISFLGAESRQGEEIPVERALSKAGLQCYPVRSPGKVDGGDVLFTGKHLFVGISERTNEEGALQLKTIFSDIETVTVPVSGSLHLKSVLSSAGPGTLFIGQSAAAETIFAAMESSANISKNYEIVRIPDDVAANVLLINSYLIIQEGFPKSEKILGAWADSNRKQLLRLDMSEFIKADGALTCCNILL